jgi:hypothetical protein
MRLTRAGIGAKMDYAAGCGKLVRDPLGAVRDQDKQARTAMTMMSENHVRSGERGKRRSGKRVGTPGLPPDQKDSTATASRWRGRQHGRRERVRLHRLLQVTT